MQYESFEAFMRAASGGRLLRGDIVYVSAELYGTLAEDQRNAIWRLALGERVRLITDLEVHPPIVVHRAGGASDIGAADALERR